MNLTMNLYDFLKFEDSDFDTYDDTFDLEITVCVPYEGTSSGDWYDKFYNFILKHVNVIKKTGECSCIVDWSKFITDNLALFREIANDMWNEGTVPTDDDDLVYEWIKELDGWLTGYVSEAHYHEFMEKYSEKISNAA